MTKLRSAEEIAREKLGEHNFYKHTTSDVSNAVIGDWVLKAIRQAQREAIEAAAGECEALTKERDKLAEALSWIAVLRSTAWSPNDYVEAFCKARGVARAALAELDKEKT